MLRNNLVEAFDAATDIPSLQRAMANVAAELGLQNFSYIRWFDRDKPTLIATYSPTWISRFLEQRYDRIDPLNIRARIETLPFLWRGADYLSGGTPAQRQMFDEAAEFGIRHGITVPLHHGQDRLAKFTVATDDPSTDPFKKIVAERDLFHLIALHFDAIAAHLCKSTNGNHDRKLSPRELECLRWAARGKSTYDTAQILGISRRTVVFHIENAKTKLGVNTVRQAIVEAMLIGLTVE